MRTKLFSTLVLTILLGSILVGCGEGSPTPSTVATLSEIEGEVSVMETDTESWTDGQVGMSLIVGDSVKTGNDSSAEITFLDGTTMELEADTEIEITSVASNDTDGTTVTITQTIGTVITRMTQLLDPAPSYETVTPSGVTAVRAYPAHPATAVVGVAGNGTSWIANQGGDVLMKGQNGIELLVPNGQRGLVMPGHSPELMPPNMPPLAHDDAFPANELNPVVIPRPGVLFNDFDPDVYDLLHVTAVNTSGTVGMLIAWGPRGAFTYDPNGQFDYLQAGNSTTDSFTYTVTDACGGNDTATVTITINGID